MSDSGMGNAPRICCEGCGYCVEGLGAGGAVTCPECGKQTSAGALWTRAPWPSGWKLGVKLCLPTAVVSAAFVALASVELAWDNLVLPLIVPWLVIVVIVGVVWPSGEAREIARRCEPMATRASRMWRVRAVSILTNGAVFATGLVCAIAVQ
ncbi:MAG: hypothetical protein ACOYN0_00925 [Phycisphaerales bacterium]